MSFLIVLITVGLLGAGTGYLGSLMISKRLGLIGGPLGHLALPGVALSLLWNFNIFLGALGSILVGVFLILYLERKTDLPLEALTGIIFATGVAIGFLLLPMSHAEEVVAGEIELITLLDFWIVLFSTFVIFFAVEKIYKKMVLATISEELAQGKGVKIKRINLIYFLAIALLTALEVKIVGIILTAALFVIPASAAKNISSRLSSYRFLCIIFGSFSTIGGALAAKKLSLASGPIIIISAALIFLFSLFFKEKSWS